MEEQELLEARADIERFIAKFGQDTYLKFSRMGQALKNKGITTDISWHSAHTSPEEMAQIISDIENKVAKDKAGEKKMNRTLVAENEKYEVWDVHDWETAMNMGDGTVWCITGRYDTDEVKPSQAEHYFNSYLDDEYNKYLFCMPKNGDTYDKYCICVHKDNTGCTIWDYDDDRVEEIPGLDMEFEYEGFSWPPEYVGERDWGEDEEDDEGAWEGDNEPIRREPAPFKLEPVENPEAMEFPAESLEAAIEHFKHGAEVVAQTNAPGLCVIKYQDAPEVIGQDEEGHDITDNGEKYTIFVYQNGVGGPLMTQTGRGQFALVTFKELDKINDWAQHNIGNIEIRTQAQDEMGEDGDVHECLCEYIEPVDDEPYVVLESENYKYITLLK